MISCYSLLKVILAFLKKTAISKIERYGAYLDNFWTDFVA